MDRGTKNRHRKARLRKMRCPTERVNVTINAEAGGPVRAGFGETRFARNLLAALKGQEGEDERAYFYTLNPDGSVRPCDMEEWGKMFNDIDRRTVGKTGVGEHTVSTVFLGTDHNWSMVGPPVLFETMVFRDVPGVPTEWDDYQERYRTYAEAKAGHWEKVNEMRAALAAVRACEAGHARDVAALKSILDETEEEPKA